MAIGWLVWAHGSDVKASCGDYLYKRGASSDQMVPMDEHRGDSRCEQEDDSLPSIPSPTRERSESDELATEIPTELSDDIDSRCQRYVNFGALSAGFRDRVDRPPQADPNSDLI